MLWFRSVYERKTMSLVEGRSIICVILEDDTLNAHTKMKLGQHRLLNFVYRHKCSMWLFNDECNERSTSYT